MGANTVRHGLKPAGVPRSPIQLGRLQGGEAHDGAYQDGVLCHLCIAEYKLNNKLYTVPMHRLNIMAAGVVPADQALSARNL